MVGILVSFWEGPFSGAMFVLGRVIVNWWNFKTDIPQINSLIPGAVDHGTLDPADPFGFFPGHFSGAFWLLFQQGFFFPSWRGDTPESPRTEKRQQII